MRSWWLIGVAARPFLCQRVYLRVEDEELDAIVLSDCGEQGPRRSPRSLTLFS